VSATGAFAPAEGVYRGGERMVFAADDDKTMAAPRLVSAFEWRPDCLPFSAGSVP